MALFSFRKKAGFPTTDQALPGRTEPIAVPDRHFVTRRPIKPPFPEGLEQAVFGLGCFWGAERKFWQTEGVWTTAAGYAGGVTPNPTYEEVCSGLTGSHRGRPGRVRSEGVSYDDAAPRLLGGPRSHPGNAAGERRRARSTARRSTRTATPSTRRRAASRDAYQPALDRAGYGPITTEIRPAPTFYYAEGYHQQYLAKNPGGYCGLGGTGVSCSAGVATAR